MGNKMISTRHFTFKEGNRNIKIKKEVLMAEEVDLPLERTNRTELVQRHELFTDECRHSENPLKVVVQEAM